MLTHDWRPVSRHATSEGEVRYERCHCGAHRIVAVTADESRELAHPR